MNKVRIIAGNLRGRTIFTPGDGTHPMGERERLALFNMVQGFLPGALVLDAFSGSGALGIEAISRGADEACFVEKSRKACQVIRENLRDLGMGGEVFCENVVNFTTDKRFEVILADPPYDRFEVTEVAHLTQFLKDGGILVLSHPGEAPELPETKLLKTKKYAGARISIYSKK